MSKEFPIKTMTKAQLGRICQGGKDVNERLEAQESHKFSMSVIALLTVLSCILGMFLLFKFVLVAIGCYHWWSMLLLWFAVSAVITGCMIIRGMIKNKNKNVSDL